MSFNSDSVEIEPLNVDLEDVRVIFRQINPTISLLPGAVACLPKER